MNELPNLERPRDPGTLSVRRLEPAMEGAWEAFVGRSPAATFFHRAAWRRVVERALGHESIYLYAWRDGRIAGVLPLTHVRSKLFGTSLLSVGFGVYGGIAADDDRAARALADEAAKLGRALRVDYVELRQMAPSGSGWPQKPDLYVTFSRTLAQSSDANLKAIPRKKRADLRKALDNKRLTVEVGGEFETFYRIYAESLRNLGTPVLPRRFYRAILEEFGPAAELSAVHGPNGPVAALMTLYFKDRTMPYYGGAMPEARLLHAYDLLYWRAIERAVAKNAPVFDFGRSKRGTGSYDYKTYWGFAPEPLAYECRPVEKDALPEINPLNPKYRLMIAAWQRLPLAIANTIGPWVARQIG
jgi:FemAB-related protein (PEP-CTERM system-associated)